jgi:hypothetical protein
MLGGPAAGGRDSSILGSLEEPFGVRWGVRWGGRGEVDGVCRSEGMLVGLVAVSWWVGWGGVWFFDVWRGSFFLMFTSNYCSSTAALNRLRR